MAEENRTSNVEPANTSPACIPWTAKSRELEATVDRQIKHRMNRWSQENMDHGVKKMRTILATDETAMPCFMHNYFKTITAYIPQTKDGNTNDNPMIQLYVDHMSKILRASDPTKEGICRDRIFFPESLVEEGKARILEHMRMKFQADFSDADFLRGTYYIMVAKHAKANVIGKDVYTVACLVFAKEAVTYEQYMALFDLIHNGPVMVAKVRHVIADHLGKIRSTLRGAAFFKCRTAITYLLD